MEVIGNLTKSVTTAATTTLVKATNKIVEVVPVLVPKFGKKLGHLRE